jgi:hypothetical protein
VSHSGKKIDLATITADDICLEDIAHHLTKICRYGGALALDLHYSVANHSLVLYDYALANGYNIELRRALLMHDAAECYLGDIVSGLKDHLLDYKLIEGRVEKIINDKYGISNYYESEVKYFDTCIVLDEALAFMPWLYKEFKEQLPDHHELGVDIHSERLIDLYKTKDRFLRSCSYLSIKD